MITEKNVVQHELIGLHAKVVEGNPSAVGIEGKIVDETMNTIKIEDKTKERTITKNGSRFMLTLPSKKKILLEGSVIVARPEDRIKKQVKKW